MTKGKPPEKNGFDDKQDSPDLEAQSLAEEAIEASDDLHQESQPQDSEASLESDESERETHEPADALQLQEENAELKEKYLRLFAEHENYRKRMNEQLDRVGKHAIDKFAREMLEVLESLDRACEIDIGDKPAPALISMRDGVDLTRKQLLDALERFSIEEIAPQVGDAFDVQWHQAMTTQPSAQMPANHIYELFRKGYRIHERLLRPAMVVVSAAAADAETGGAGSEAPEQS